jgi:hypothetical protein
MATPTTLADAAVLHHGVSSVTVAQFPVGTRYLLVEKLDDPHKEDLDDTARDVRANLLARTRVAVAMREPTPLLESYLGREMLVGGGTAMELFRAWCANTHARAEREFSSLNQAMASTSGFLEAAHRFERRIVENLRAQFQAGNIDYRDLVTGPGPTRLSFGDVPAVEPGRFTQRNLPSIAPPLVSLSLTQDRACKICIGSIQGIRIWLTNLQVNTSSHHITGQLRYQIRDHFGVDDEDCEVAVEGFHGTPGQVAMWVLQHHRRPGHLPWITVVHVDRVFHGSLV